MRTRQVFVYEGCQKKPLYNVDLYGAVNKGLREKKERSVERLTG